MSQSETIRLLVINDSESEVERLLSMLRNSGRNTRAQHVVSIEALEKLLNEHAWDLLIAIDESKQCEAKAALRLVKRLDKDVPAILLTEAEEELQAMALIDGLKAGARDVVVLDDDQHLLMVMTRELTNLEERRQRRAADRRFKESERRCQQLLDSSRDAIAYIEDGLFLYANQSFAERFGYTDVDDVIVMPLIDMVADKDHERYKQFMKDFQLSEEPGAQELSVMGMTESGNEFQALLVVSRGNYEQEPCIQLTIHASTSDSVSSEEPSTQVANVDSVTGLHNRQHLMDVLAESIRDAAEQDKYRSLHLVSIDRFDTIRADIGLSGCDDLFASLATVLKGLESEAGVSVARFGDEEFALLVSGTDEEQQVKRALDICRLIEQHICDAGEKTIQVTASIGVCPITEKATSPDEILNRAHEALDEARATSTDKVGNNAKYYVPKVGEGEQDAQQMLEVVDHALGKDRFQLLFQPVISLRGVEEEHYEVSLRMLEDEEGKRLGTSEIFEALKADDELAKKLDRWVILNASKALAQHRAADHETRIFVNLTHASIRDDSLVPWIGVACKAADIPTNSMIFQLNEADVTNYLNNTKQFTDGLHDLGSFACVEHFGCALDPFKALQHVEFDFIKVDGSFTRDIQDKGESPDTLKELLAKLEEIDKPSIVPAVEQATMLATTWQAGAHYIQGEYFQVPGPEMNFDFSDDE